MGKISNSRLKKTAAVVPTPRTRAEMEDLVAQIADRKRAEALAKLEMDERIAAIKTQYTDALAGIEAELQPLLTAAETWATNNPEAFGKAKSLRLLHGVVGFRTTTPKLEPLSRKWTWATITEAVCATLPAFVRSKPEVDKEAIIAQRDELASLLPLVGLRVTQTESFFVEPEVTKVEPRETVEAK